MSLQSAHSLAAFCKEEAGSLLRSVVHYDGDGYEVLHIRDDVAEQYTEDELAEYFEFLSAAERLDDRQAEALRVGSHHGTLRLYDEALILQFPQGPDVGTIVAFDPEAGQEISAFVLECLARLHRDSAQRIPHAPDWDGL